MGLNIGQEKQIWVVDYADNIIVIAETDDIIFRGTTGK